MKPETPCIRIEDEDVSIALSSDDFEKMAKAHLPQNSSEEMLLICDRITFYRGHLPDAPRLIAKQLWWLLGVLLAIIFLYGLYSIALKLFALIVP